MLRLETISGGSPLTSNVYSGLCLVTESFDVSTSLFPGVIVAIVIAGVAVLVATIRLLVYCCQRRSPQ